MLGSSNNNKFDINTSIDSIDNNKDCLYNLVLHARKNGGVALQ